MNSRNTISDELKAFESQLQAGLNHPPYSVPQGYFENLAATILNRIHSENVSSKDEISMLSPLLAGIPRKMPFELPSGYFAESAGNVLPSIHQEESLVLSFISKEMPYQVPQGYFMNLPDKILEKLDTSRGKMISMRTKWMRMAAAAVVTGILAISGILYFNRDQPVPAGSESIAIEVEKASQEELDAFITSTTGTSTTQEQKSAITEEAKALLDDVSDQELEAFLSNIPTEDLPIADEEMDLLYN